MYFCENPHLSWQTPRAGSIINKPLKKLIVLLALSAGLSACTALQDFLAPLRDDSAEALPAATAPIAAKPRLEPISRNYFILGSPEQAVIGEPQLVYANEEDTFSDLAREYGLGYDELIAANPGVDPWLPGTASPVLLPTQYVIPDVPRQGIILNIASKRLFYFPPAVEGQQQAVITYPIGIGRVGWETPLGESTVISKARDPHWYVPASVRQEHRENGDPLPAVVPPGPDNPLGRHVLKLGIPGYLIHGTNQPYGVGMRVSHGCVRLYPENIELLYELVDRGEPVRIVNEPYLAAWHDGEVYFESHAPLEDDSVTPDEHLARILTFVENGAGGRKSKASAEQLRSIATAALGIPVKVNKADTNEMLARARVIRNTYEPDPDTPTLAEARAMLDELLLESEAAEQVAADE